MKCLSQLGAASSQLVLQLHGDGGKQWQKDIQSEYPAATWSSAEQAGGVHGSRYVRSLLRFTKRKEAKFRMDGIFTALLSVCT